jgi:hypothetical protein
VYGSAAAYDVQHQRLVGTFAGGQGLAIDSTARRIFVLLHGSLRAYDMDTLALLASENTSASDDFSLSQPLVRWGRYGLAFGYTTDPLGPAALYLGRSVLIP